DQVLLDEPNLHFPDATDVAFTPDGRRALVTSSGSDRVAVVGTGRWGQNHVRTWHKLGVLRALCEPEAATRAHLPQDVPCFTDLGALLADCPVDIVVLATPASTHAALAEQALRAGADVLIEKPMALSVAEAQGVLQTAETEGRLVAVGHLLLYHPAVVELSRLLQAGALGRVQRIIARRLNFGTLRSHENVLWSFGPHDFALLSHLLGQAPVSVRASGQAVVDPNVTDMVDVHLRYASGVQATVQLSWLHPVKEHRLIVIGERQMAVFDDTLPWADKLTLYPHRIEAGRPPKAIKAEGRPVALIPALPLEQQGRAVLETWRSRRPALADGAHGLAVLRLLCAAEQALAVPDGATLAPPDAVAVPTRPAPPQHLQHPSARIHPSAEVEAGARLGEGVRIWHQAHVMAGAQLGDGVSLGQNVFVGAGVHIGAGSKLQNNVSVFEGVHLAEAVFCGPGCIFTNVKRPRADHPRRGPVGRLAPGPKPCAVAVARGAAPAADEGEVVVQRPSGRQA
ncbi:MAG: Gfo/Idh/MocA family oxidoreductase, partial [Polyangiales bacterium]